METLRPASQRISRRLKLEVFPEWCRSYFRNAVWGEQRLLYWSFKETVKKSIIVGLKIELETNVHEVFNPRLLAPKIGRLMGSMG